MPALARRPSGDAPGVFLEPFLRSTMIDLSPVHTRRGFHAPKRVLQTEDSRRVAGKGLFPRATRARARARNFTAR